MPKGPRKFHFSFEKVGLTRFGGLSLFQSFCKSLGLRHFLQLYVRLARLPSPKLSSRRSFSSSPVFDGGWNWSHRERSVIDSQRSNTAASRPARVSSPRHFEELSLALWPQRIRQFGSRSRPTASRLLPSLRTSAQCHCGCRYHSPVDLRSSRRSRRRLCPQKAPRPTFLCADHLQRRPMWPDSRNGTQSRQRPSHHRSFKLLKPNVGQTPLLDCGHPHPTSIGRSLLRQKDHRSYRPATNRLCRFRQDDPAPQKQDDCRSLSAVCPGLGSSRVLLYAFSLAKTASLCGRAPSCGVGTRSIQQRLFTFKQYTYHQALVTNLEPTPAAVWRFYCDRGFQELLLREFKGSYTMAKIPTRSFWANAAYMEMVLWAYDLVLAFQYLCLPEEIRNWNIATLRRELWWLPAEWVRRENRNVLVLPAKYPRQDLFLKIQQASEKVRPII